MPLRGRDNRDLLAQATRAASAPGVAVIPAWPNDRITTPAECDFCNGPMPVPRRADRQYCRPLCQSRARRLRRDTRTSLD
jgi:hypothetical protein